MTKNEFTHIEITKLKGDVIIYVCEICGNAGLPIRAYFSMRRSTNAAMKDVIDILTKYGAYRINMDTTYYEDMNAYEYIMRCDGTPSDIMRLVENASITNGIYHGWER